MGEEGRVGEGLEREGEGESQGRKDAVLPQEM